MSFESFKAAVGFTKTPDRPGDSDQAFMDFVVFSNGDSESARAIRRDFTAGRHAPGETQKQTVAAFIDWLIVNHWGELIAD